MKKLKYQTQNPMKKEIGFLYLTGGIGLMKKDAERNFYAELK